MGQDEKQSTAQTSDITVEHETETCDSEEVKQKDGDCAGKESTSSEEVNDGSSSSAGTKDAPSKKGDRDARGREIWEGITRMTFLIMAAAIIFIMSGLIVGVDVVVMVMSYAGLLIIFTTMWFDFEEEIPSHVSSPKRWKIFVKKHKRPVIVLSGLSFLPLMTLLFLSGVGMLGFCIVMIYLLFVASASGGVLFCWGVKDAKDAREQAIGMMTVASVAGILLTLALALMPSNQTLSDCVCESCSSNEALVDTYQDESYGG